jgi:hypothetical protein
MTAENDDQVETSQCGQLASYSPRAAVGGASGLRSSTRRPDFFRLQTTELKTPQLEVARIRWRV